MIPTTPLPTIALRPEQAWQRAHAVLAPSVDAEEAVSAAHDLADALWPLVTACPALIAPATALREGLGRWRRGEALALDELRRLGIAAEAAAEAVARQARSRHSTEAWSAAAARTMVLAGDALEAHLEGQSPTMVRFLAHRVCRLVAHTLAAAQHPSP